MGGAAETVLAKAMEGAANVGLYEEFRSDLITGIQEEDVGKVGSIASVIETSVSFVALLYSSQMLLRKGERPRLYIPQIAMQTVAVPTLLTFFIFTTNAYLGEPIKNAVEFVSEGLLSMFSEEDCLGSKQEL
jgi:hypothetical protein